MSATKSAPMALSIVMVEGSSAVLLRVTFWVGSVGVGAVIVGGGAERDLPARLDWWEVCFRVRSAPEVWDVDEVLLDAEEAPAAAVAMESGGPAGSWMQSANSEG